MKPRGLFLSLRRYVCASVVHKCRNISHTFACGELALATDQKGRKYLFELKENGQLQLSSGKILHSTIIAGCPGQSFKTHLGTTGLVVRRPSLEEFTLLMARGPTPTYPKDILAMIGLMNVNHGSRVIEAGSGSGAMTLHLSKAVGCDGMVYSFEVKDTHLEHATRNYRRWLRSQDAQGRSWPDNVQFFHNDLANVSQHISKEVDAVALDVVDSTAVVSQVAQVLKPSGVVVAYLPNVTQVVALVDHIDRTSCLECEDVLEVIYRHWTVMPAWKKHGYRTSLPPQEHPEQGNESTSAQNRHFISRPKHFQPPHTAFLVQLRKVMK
ncbi:hypothetical protein EMCRGX_G032391 [Ephydatia muelleri]|eukprot:Em0019g300a